MNTAELIEKCLKKSIQVTQLTILDDSQKHATHPQALQAGGGHYQIVVVSEDFEGKTTLQRHRIIYTALRNEMKGNIHALSIKAYSVKEFKKT